MPKQADSPIPFRTFQQASKDTLHETRRRWIHIKCLTGTHRKGCGAGRRMKGKKSVQKRTQMGGKFPSLS